jgi:hypothetical protein
LSGVLREFQDALLKRRVVAGYQSRSAGKGVNHAPAGQAADKSETRFAENKKLFSEMENLKRKVENADPVAAKKFDRGYDKLFENGEKAVKAAQDLLKKYDTLVEDSDGDDAAAREATLEMMDTCIRKVESNRVDHLKAKGAMSAAQKLHAATNTYGYTQELESYVKGLYGVIKDPDFVLDDSWRG